MPSFCALIKNDSGALLRERLSSPNCRIQERRATAEPGPQRGREALPGDGSSSLREVAGG